MAKKQEKREKQANEFRKAVIEEAKHKKLKYDTRRIQAKELVNKSITANEQKGVKMYTQYIREIEKRIEEERKKQKELSHLEYENYRKKYETSV